MKKKTEHDCDCHRKIGDSMTCRLDCINCSGAETVKTTETKDYKKIEIYFNEQP